MQKRIKTKYLPIYIILDNLDITWRTGTSLVILKNHSHILLILLRLNSIGIAYGAHMSHQFLFRLNYGAGGGMKSARSFSLRHKAKVYARGRTKKVLTFFGNITASSSFR